MTATRNFSSLYNLLLSERKMTEDGNKQTFTSLKDSVAIITGGASGLGRACAERLAPAGVKVVIVDLPNSPYEEVVSQSPASTEFFAADVTSEADIQALVEHVSSKYNRLDICINSAGIGGRQATYDFETNQSHSLELFIKILQVNTVGTFNVVRLVTPLMGKNAPDSQGQRGVIINVGSSLGAEGSAGFAAYSASKAAVAGMTLPLARELGAVGIRVVTVSPGLCDTPMLQRLPQEKKDFYSAEFASVTAFPKRLGKPEEFAHMIQAVIENRMINGEVLRLDGGARNP